MNDRTSHLPLAGISVLVTRALEQSAGLVEDLTSRGAKVEVIPAVSISPLAEPEGLAKVLGRVDAYDNVVFTSVNGVVFTSQLLLKKGMGPRDLPPALCVGEKTAGAWKEAGGHVAAVPEQYTARALLEALDVDLSGRTFLIMRPELVKTELGAAMRERGAEVDEIIIYRTVSPEDGVDKLDGLLRAGKPDVVLFASPSAVEGIMKMQGAGRRAQGAPRPGSGQAGRSLLNIPAICIGPTTAKAAEETGFSEIYFPDEHTAGGMVEELLVIAGALKTQGAEER